MMPGMGSHEKSGTRAPRWPLLLIAAPASVAVWSGWVGLGLLCGFGVIHPLPGIWGSLRVNTDITLPVGVESYGAFALYVWLASGAGPRTRKFACLSALGALSLGCVGQVAYHLLAAAHAARAPSAVVVVVACLPVVTLSLAAALLHLMHAEAAERAAAEAAEMRAAMEAERARADAERTRKEAADLAIALAARAPETPAASAPKTRQPRARDARQPAVSERDKRNEMARQLLIGTPAMSRADVASAAGVSERTVDRIKKELGGAPSLRVAGAS